MEAFLDPKESSTMATRTDYGFETDFATAQEDTRTDRGSGWLMYAAIMLGFAATYNVIDGVLALANSKVYAANATYVFSDLRTWGWIVLLLGILEGIAAFTVLAGSNFARWFGVAAAGLNAIGQLMFVSAYPFWALAMFATDLLIIYALAVYGGQKRAA
jgi:hypothetical protein